MDAKYYGIVELALTGALVLGFGFWQLWSLRRDKSDDDPRHPEG